MSFQKICIQTHPYVGWRFHLEWSWRWTSGEKKEQKSKLTVTRRCQSYRERSHFSSVFYISARVASGLLLNWSLSRVQLRVNASRYWRKVKRDLCNCTRSIALRTLYALFPISSRWTTSGNSVTSERKSCHQSVRTRSFFFNFSCIAVSELSSPHLCSIVLHKRRWFLILFRRPKFSSIPLSPQ